jgi:hypothetical protein
MSDSGERALRSLRLAEAFFALYLNIFQQPPHLDAATRYSIQAHDLAQSGEPVRGQAAALVAECLRARYLWGCNAGDLVSALEYHEEAMSWTSATSPPRHAVLAGAAQTRLRFAIAKSDLAELERALALAEQAIEHVDRQLLQKLEMAIYVDSVPVEVLETLAIAAHVHYAKVQSTGLVSGRHSYERVSKLASAASWGAMRLIAWPRASFMTMMSTRISLKDDLGLSVHSLAPTPVRIDARRTDMRLIVPSQSSSAGLLSSPAPAPTAFASPSLPSPPPPQA